VCRKRRTNDEDITDNAGWRRGRSLRHPDVRRGLQIVAWAWIITLVIFIIALYYFFI
jgi:hypothetical protein